MELHYARIYADAEGESHFEDLAMPLVSADLAPPMKPVPLSAPIAAARLVHFHGPQELDGGAWHTAPTRQFMYVLSGTVEITVSDGQHASGRGCDRQGALRQAARAGRRHGGTCATRVAWQRGQVEDGPARKRSFFRHRAWQARRICNGPRLRITFEPRRMP